MPWIIDTDLVNLGADESLVDHTGGVTVDNASGLDDLPYRFMLCDGDGGMTHYLGRFSLEAFDTIDEGGDGCLTAALMLGAVVSGTTDLYVLSDDLERITGGPTQPDPALDVMRDGLRWRRVI